MNADQVINEFKATGALLEGHFQLSSGLHSTVYLQCALVLQFPERAESFGRAIAEKYRGEGIQLVASPAIGGIVIGHEVARALDVADEILIVGPSAAKLEFVKYMNKNEHALDPRILGVETVEHPSDKRLIDFATLYFKGRGPSPRNGSS